ncbi:MAG: DUF2155 domain-containing protein [Pseudomonadota bacterium]
MSKAVSLCAVLLTCAPMCLWAQNTGDFTTSTLPGLGEPGQLEGEGFTGFDGLEPSLGLESTGVPNPDMGIIENNAGQIFDENGVMIQIDPGGQEGVALIQAPNLRAEPEAQAVAAVAGQAVTLRGLDKTLAATTDFEMRSGETVLFGRVAIRMLECRHPADNPASDAFAHLQIATLEGEMLFDGWMIASSPALMALEHPRYDVWVLRCSTS